MKWRDLLSEAAAKVARDYTKITEEAATPIAHAFFDEELYPRMQRLQAAVAQNGRYEAVLQPSPRPPEGMTWRLEHISLRVFHRGELSSQSSSIAYISFDYRVDLLCDAEVVMKTGWRNLGVFWLAGEPIDYIEPSIEEFVEHLG